LRRLHASEETIMDPVVHFEMAYADRDRMAKFYTEAFGWQSQKLGLEMGNYVVAVTTPSPDNMPTTPGHINGGFYQKSADKPEMNAPSVVIAVADIKQAMTKVRNAGGTVLGEPMAIPGIGDYVSFLDTEGNRASILQPSPR